MTPQEIIDYAIEFREYYLTRDARVIADSLGIAVTEYDFDPKFFRAHFLRSGSLTPIICVNSCYTDFSQNVLCAHELGHALLHNTYYNEFATTMDPVKQKQEYEANLFAVALLCDEEDFIRPLSSLSNYELKSILDLNLKFK